MKFSLNAFDGKINFIYYKLFRVLKYAKFRTKVNIWQIMVAPLIRMCLSLVGEVQGSEADKDFELINKKIRTTLKRFTLMPKQASNNFFNFVGNANKELYIKILKQAITTGSYQSSLSQF